MCFGAVEQLLWQWTDTCCNVCNVVPLLFLLLCTAISDCTMVPVMDMLNHNDGGGGLVAVAFEDSPEKIHSVGVLATKNIAAGEEVVDSYDPESSLPNAVKTKKCVQDLFVGFGFLSSSLSSSSSFTRPWCFDMSMTIHTQTFALPSLNMCQIKLLGRYGASIGSDWSVQLIEGDSVLSSSLLAVIRLCMAGEKDMLIAQHRGSAMEPLSVQNEKKVLAMIYQVMETNLENIPSSNAEDLWVLGGGDPTANDTPAVSAQMRAALQIRVHERNICVETLKLTRDAWLDVLFLVEETPA